MKFVNVIREGDFVRLMTFEKMLSTYNGEEGFCPVMGGRSIEIVKDDEEHDFILLKPNLLTFLGGVVRIKSAWVSEYDEKAYFMAECKGIEFPYEDGDCIEFEGRCIESVLVNGKWYDAHESLNKLIEIG